MTYAPTDEQLAAFARLIEDKRAISTGTNGSSLARTEVEEFDRAYGRHAAEEFLSAIADADRLLDRAQQLPIPGTTRYTVSDSEWAKAELRVAAARRRCARELSVADADALVTVLEAKTTIDPSHVLAAREIADRLANPATD